MLHRVNRLVRSVLLAEGGYWDDPVGGPTNYGIRQKTLDALRKKYPTLPSSVEELSEDDAGIIIEREYIVKQRIHHLPDITALVQSHMCVMSWDDGIRILQARLGVTPDGIIGPKTIHAAHESDLILEYRGNLDDINQFLDTRTNGYESAYETRFAKLFK